MKRFLFFSILILNFFGFTSIGLTANGAMHQGDIVVLEQGSVTGTITDASVFRVDPLSGIQTIISQGELLSNSIGENPTGLAFEVALNRFLVVDRKNDLIEIDIDGNQALGRHCCSFGYAIR
jgi:hypothetical protein